MAENARNEQATRHGGPNSDSEPGSYQLAEDVAALLAGQDLGLDIQGFEIGALRFVANASAMAKRKVSMLALELRTDIGLSQSPSLVGELDDFTDFHANWDAAPFTLAGNPTLVLPADATDDATDHVELEQ